MILYFWYYLKCYYVELKRIINFSFIEGDMGKKNNLKVIIYFNELLCCSKDRENGFLFLMLWVFYI